METKKEKLFADELLAIRDQVAPQIKVNEDEWARIAALDERALHNLVHEERYALLDKIIGPVVSGIVDGIEERCIAGVRDKPWDGLIHIGEMPCRVYYPDSNPWENDPKMSIDDAAERVIDACNKLGLWCGIRVNSNWIMDGSRVAWPPAVSRTELGSGFYHDSVLSFYVKYQTPKSSVHGVDFFMNHKVMRYKGLDDYREYNEDRGGIHEYDPSREVIGLGW